MSCLLILAHGASAGDLVASTRGWRKRGTNMIYYVTFDTQRNRCTTDWIFHCDARNAAEAVSIAKQEWSNLSRPEHQFHLHGGKSRIQDQDLLRVRAAETWAAVKSGDQVMNRFIRLGDHHWLRQA